MKKFLICLFTLMLFMPACSNAKQNKTTKPSVQEPVVSGVFYPGNPMLLMQVVEKYLADAPKKDIEGKIVGLIAPHAGYRYSGSVAAQAFKQVKGKKYKTVVVIAPSHRMPLQGAALSTKDVYKTPLGNIPIAKEVVKKLIDTYAWAEDDQRPFQMEHALEVELPFLQVVLKDFKLVPIILGTHDKEILDSMAKALVKELPGDDVLLVASTDLSHYKPYDEAVQCDRETLSYIESGDSSKFWKAENSGKVLACGAGPSYIVMKIWELKGGGTVDVLQYKNSGDTAGDKSKVVGYAAVAFVGKNSSSSAEVGEGEGESQGSLVFSLTEAQKKKLLKLARDTVTAFVNGKELPSTKTEDAILNKDGASFVTLKRRGELRGCMGNIIAREPLIKNVQNMAVNSAARDPRFPPVRPSELKNIHVEVSVLTPPTPLKNPTDVDVGKDGLIISRGFNRGVLLPQVPVEQGWDKDEYLKGICHKAGMEATCWRNAKLQRFQAIVFGE